jgi:hypothetical protein
VWKYTVRIYRDEGLGSVNSEGPNRSYVGYEILFILMQNVPYA